MFEYKFICDMGHDPKELMVTAENDEEAMIMMMEKTKEHLAQDHEAMTMSDEETMEMIKNGWTKEEKM